jgi:hypothetical protein
MSGASSENRINRWHCSHPRDELRVKTFANGTKHPQRQCLVCGKDSSTFLKHALCPPLDSLPAWDESIRERWSESIRKTLDEERDREDREWREAYARYLASPEWRRQRLRTFVERKGICQGCRRDLLAGATSFPPMFHIHHVHELGAYRVAFGDEMLFQLVLLCPSCHAKFPSKFDEENGIA